MPYWHLLGWGEILGNVQFWQPGGIAASFSIVELP